MSAPIDYIANVAAGTTFDALDKAIVWEQRDAPRAEAYYADRDVPYTYGRGAGERTYHPNTVWAEPIAAVRRAVEEICGCAFALLFCNRYEDARQHLGWHADDGVIIDHSRPIAVVSFGAARAIDFRPRPDRVEAGADTPVTRLVLEPGSLLVMKAGMQQTHQHRIPKCDRVCGPRISLTFRALVGG